MLLLALDSADATGSAAVWDCARPEPGALLGHRRLVAGRGQADQLIPLADDLLRDLGLDYEALGALAVGHGPGSFTGIRSAVAAARGLALAAALPVLAVGSLEALAAAVPDAEGTLVAAIDARRGEVYVQIFDAGRRARGAPAVLTPAEAVAGLPDGPLRLVGSGTALVRAALPADRAPMVLSAELDARWVARRAAERLRSGERPQDGSTLHPLYLRPPDARPQMPLVAPARAQAVEA